MKPVALFSLFLLAILVIPQDCCHAQMNYWEQTSGPQGGDVFSLGVDSTGRILAGTNRGLYARSASGGDWMTIGLNEYAIQSLAVHFDGTIVAGSSDGVFTTTDQGSSWIDSDLSVETSFLVLGSSGYLFAVGSSEGIYRSIDRGAHWEEVHEGQHFGLAVSSTGELFTSDHYDFLRSSDQGNSWEAIPVAVFPHTFCMGPMDRIYGGTYDGSCPQPVHPCSPQAGIFCSTDRGETWTVASWGLNIDRVMGAPLSGIFVIPTQANLARYDQTDSTLTFFDVGQVNVAMETADSTLYCGRAGWGVFTSVDRGTSWWEVNGNLTSSVVSSIIAMDSVSLLAGSFPRLWRTTDRGDSWDPVIEFDGYGQCHFIESVGTSIFAGVSRAGIYESTDLGVTWANRHFEAGGVDWIGANVYSILAKGSDSLLAGAKRWDLYGWEDRGVFLSIDGGQFWTKIGLDGMSARSLGLDSTGVILAGTWSDGIYRSTDDGGTWAFSGVEDGSIASILVTDENVVLTATEGDGIFRSVNNGAEWSPVNQGLTTLRISSLEINSDGEIFAASFDQGIFVSSDDGLSWSEFATGLTNRSVLSLAIGPDDRAYVGTDGKGVFRTTSPTTSVQDPEIATPGELLLMQNYPNPFNGISNFEFGIANLSHVSLIIYDLLGREVATVVNEKLGPGTYTRQWNAAGVASGVYYCWLTVGDFISVKKLILLR